VTCLYIFIKKIKPCYYPYPSSMNVIPLSGSSIIWILHHFSKSCITRFILRQKRIMATTITMDDTMSHIRSIGRTSKQRTTTNSKVKKDYYYDYRRICWEQEEQHRRQDQTITTPPPTRTATTTNSRRRPGAEHQVQHRCHNSNSAPHLHKPCLRHKRRPRPPPSPQRRRR
jgi:hypothetical protein